MTIDTTFPPALRRSAAPQLDEKQLGTFRVPTEYLRGAGDTGDMYGLIVEGNCLDPLIKDGDHVVIAPRAKFVTGDFVAIWPSNPAIIPQIKRVVSVPPNNWRKWHPDRTVTMMVEMLNPHRLIPVDLGKIAAIHRVIAWFGAEQVELILPPKATRRRAGAAV